MRLKLECGHCSWKALLLSPFSSSTPSPDRHDGQFCLSVPEPDTRYRRQRAVHPVMSQTLPDMHLISISRPGSHLAMTCQSRGRKEGKFMSRPHIQVTTRETLLTPPLLCTLDAIKVLRQTQAGESSRTRSKCDEQLSLSAGCAICK